MTYVADNFNRGNGPLGGFWSTPIKPSTGSGIGGIQLLNNAFTASVGSCNYIQSVVQGYTFGNDQWAQITLAATPTNKSTLHITACSSSAGTSTYTYTLTAGAALFVGQQVYISGMTNSGNNSTTGFLVTALGSGTFSVSNATPGANESGSNGTGIGPGDSWVGLVLRGTPDGQNGYFCFVGINSGAFAGNGVTASQYTYTHELWKVVGGTFTFLAGSPQTGAIPDSSGTVYRMSIIGTQLRLFRNGVQILSATDSSLTSGSPGIQASSNSGVGEFANPTNYNTNDTTFDTTMQANSFLAGDTPGQLASDNFARGAGGLGTNWTTNPSENAPSIVSSGIVDGPTISANNGAYYNAVSLPNDQFSEVTVAAFGGTSTSFVLPKCRQSASAKTSYSLQVSGALGAGAATFTLFRIVGGTQTSIASATGQTLTVGDVLRVSAVGTTITAYQNGFQVLQAVDTNIAAGSGGFTLQALSATNAEISLWAGGNANVIPNYPSGSNRIHAGSRGTQVALSYPLGSGSN